MFKMFNRKRLFERRSKYHETGIPCGNPKRVQTGEVLCMPSTTSAAEQPQGDDLETEGEKHLRALAKKQLKTDISMKELLTQQRHFTDAWQYKPLAKEIRGVMGLQEYQDMTITDQHVESLRECGLSESEIRFKLQKEGMDKGLPRFVQSNSTFGAHPDAQDAQLHSITSKMKDKEASLCGPVAFRGLKEISRQEMEIEKSIFSGTDGDRKSLISLLVEKKSSVNSDPRDPINQLPQLVADVEQRAREHIMAKRRQRRRNRRRKDKESADNHCTNAGGGSEGEDNESGVIGCLTFEETMALRQFEKNTLDNSVGNTETGTVSSELSGSSTSRTSDSHTVPHNHTSLSVDSDQAALPLDSSCRDSETSRSGAETIGKVLKGPVEFLPAEYIKEHQMSVDHIRQLPRFTSYEPGSVSKVLYIKNLSPRVAERDLVSLFGRFQGQAGSEIIYRLMTGRMRGQAFITFEDSAVASQALELVNGFILHGKPLIIQYGKQTVT